eukprot:XP_028334718.1 glutamic acid-rich protein-like [Physeter catodon]
MKSYEGGPRLLSWSRQRTQMTVCGFVCFALLSVIFKQQQAALSLNVDQAREALSATDNGSYTEMHAPSNEGDREHAEESDLGNDQDEGMMHSFLDSDEELEDSEDSDIAEKDDKLSFLEDMDDAELDDEDYDFDAVDDEDAKAIADTMEGEEQKAFLQRWEAHKANRQANGHPDKRGSFAEF